LIYNVEFEDRSEASKKEKWLKSGAGRDYLKKKLLVSEVQSAAADFPRYKLKPVKMAGFLTKG
jgi:hypothetical protein